MKQLWEMTLAEFLEMGRKGEAQLPTPRDRADGKRWLRSVEHRGCPPEDVACTYVKAADDYCGSPRTGYWWYLNDAFIQGRISAALLRRRDRQIFMPVRYLTDDERNEFVPDLDAGVDSAA